jgi:hypothetical protein
MAAGRGTVYDPGMKHPAFRQASRRSSIRTFGPFAPLFTGLSVVALLAGCASDPDSDLVSAPPPTAPAKAVTTTTTTVSTPAAVAVTNPNAPAPVVSTTVVTQQAPPVVQQDVVLAQPSSQHVWVPGYWTWRNERYEWMAGHWELPPRSGERWVAPRWEQQGNAYRFYEGYWL